MKFTAADAFEAAEEGAPIMLTRADAQHICALHISDDCTIEAYEAQHGPQTQVNAALLLGWLGY